MSEKERPQGVFDWLKNGSPEKPNPMQNEEKKAESSVGWALAFFTVATILCFYTMGILGIIPLFLFAILWRIVKVLEEIRDKKKE